MTKRITSLFLACALMAGLFSFHALAADKPTVDNLTLYTVKDKVLRIDLATALTDGTPPVTYSITKSPSHGGVVRVTPANSDKYDYTPASGFTGTDTINFTAANAEGTSNTGTVTINVVTPGPIARNITINAVAGKPVKAELDVLEPEGLNMTFEIVSHPAKGSVTTPTATVAADADNPEGSFTYTANADASGTDSFTYRAINQNGLMSDVATVTVKFVSGIPTADNLTLNVVKNTTKEGKVTATDPIGRPLTFSTVLTPRNGTLVLTAAEASEGGLDAVDFAASGTFHYIPNKDYVGPDSFTFRATNDSNQVSNVATVTINVGVSKPTAEDITITVTRNGSETERLKGFNPVTNSATGLTYAIEATPQRGSITMFDSATGEFTYAPKKNRLGTDTFKYSVSNGTEKSDLGTVSVKIVSEAYDPIEYADMKWGHWAHEPVGILSAMDMITGEKIQKLYYFRPDANMNRSDFVLFLNAVMEIVPDKGATDSLFDDVTENWLIPPLNAAKTAGVTAGSTVNGKTNFNPYGSLSRIEAVVFISNVLKLPNADVSLNYADNNSIPTWAVQHLKNMSAYEILSGYPDGTFRPSATVTRAEAAVMLLKTYREKLLQMSRAADADEGTPNWTGTEVLFRVIR